MRWRMREEMRWRMREEMEIGQHHVERESSEEREWRRK